MERYTFNGDGVYPVVPEWNTSTTTVTVGSFPEGVTVAVGVASSDGWSPLDGGDLTSGSTVTLTHGHDAQLQVLISGLTGSVTLDFRKEGTPSQYNLLEQIAENTMSPIKEEAPVGGHWRNDGSWELDPIQEDAPSGRHARDGDNGWVDIEPDLLAIPEKMEWKGPWVASTYEKNDVVTDQGWLMIANKQTDDKAAPQPLGPPSLTLPDVPGFVTQQDASVVYTGHLYTFTEGGWFKGLRVWVPVLSPTTNYRFVVIRNPYTNPITAIIEEPVLNQGAWTTLSLTNAIVAKGEQVLIYIDALDSGSSTSWQYPWTYGGRSSFGAPATGQWNTNNGQTTLRIAKDDGDGTNHNLELQVVPNTTFTITQLSDPNKSVTYLVTGTYTDNGSYYSYPVEEVDEGIGGIPDVNAGTQIRAEQPVASPTDYVEITNYWDTAPVLSFATIQGFKQYDGIDQPGNENSAYGVDILFQRASISEDWDALSFGEQSSAATGGSGKAIDVLTLGSFEQTDSVVPTGLGATGAVNITFGTGGDTSGGEFTVAPDGVITCNLNTVQYEFDLTIRLQRTSASGIARPIARMMYADDGVNFVQVGGTFGVELDDANTIWRENFTLRFSPSVGSKMYFELARDPSGNNSGEIGTYQPTGDLAGWNQIPSTLLEIYKVVVQ